MKKARLSVIVIAKNEEAVIKDCLESVRQLADEIVFIDTGSTDGTLKIAKKYSPRIIEIKSKKLAYARWRNRGLREARGDWVLYLDADERITPQLKNEILRVISDQRSATGRKLSDHQPPVTRKKQITDHRLLFTGLHIAYAIPRRNFYLGQEMHYGGAWPDYVKRLFKRNKLAKWKGRLHEEPTFQGELGHLKEPMLHITHRDLSSMVGKTRKWSKIEAELLYQAGHPPVTWWRIFGIMLRELWRRAVKLQGWRDGTVGWIEIIFQMFSRFITYARLWELQVQEKK